MQFIGLLSILAVHALLPLVLNKAFFEKGVYKNGRIICKGPLTMRLAFAFGVVLCFFILFMAYITEEEKRVVDYVLYGAMFVLMMIFFIATYIFTRYKIICDLNEQEIVIYRLVAPKKRIPFSYIYSQVRKGDITTVKGINDKKLFVFPSTPLVIGSGYFGLDTCLCEAIKSNQKHQPIDMKEINRQVDNAIYLGLIKKK